MNDTLGLAMIGTQRSGTNLLRLMLHQEKEVVALHPPHILQVFFPLLAHYGNLDSDKNWGLLCQDVCNWVDANPVPWTGISLDPQTFLTDGLPRSLPALMVRIYHQAAKAKGARWWVNKSMSQVHYLDQLESDVPGLHYLHVYRDGRDVALSFQKAVVGHKHIYCLAESWAREQMLAASFIQQIGPERGFSLSYESLLADPEGVLNQICLFMGIPFRLEMLTYYQSKESKETAASGAMWANVVKPLLAGNSGKFLKEMTHEDLSCFESVAGQALERLGYPLYSGVKPGERSYTSEEIKAFRKENEILQARAREDMDEEDAFRRKPQARLLAAIKTRFGIA